MLCVLLQEKDPSADAAFAAAKSLQQQSMQSAAGDINSAAAVDGFVPKLKPSKAPLKQPKPASPKPTQAPAPQHAVINSSGSVPNQQQAEGSSCSTPQGNEPSLKQSPLNLRSTAGSTSQSTQKSEAHTRHSDPTAGSNPLLAGQPGTSAQTGSASGDHTARLKPNASVASGAAVASDDGSSSAQTVAEAGAQEGTDLRPVISFEVEDAAGPLEVAEHGISATFGRLTVWPCVCLALSVCDTLDQGCLVNVELVDLCCSLCTCILSLFLKRCW